MRKKYCLWALLAVMAGTMEKANATIQEQLPNPDDDNDISKTVQLDEMVVSANKNTVRRKDAPVVVSVINAKMMEQVNAPDLAKTLSFQSGLRVENNCQNCGFPQVRINGLDGAY